MSQKGQGVKRTREERDDNLEPSAKRLRPTTDEAERGIAARRKEKAGDYEAALEEYKALAAENFELAQYRLGSIYQNGICGQKQDLEKAASYYKSLADCDLPSERFSPHHNKNFGELSEESILAIEARKNANYQLFTLTKKPDNQKYFDRAKQLHQKLSQLNVEPSSTPVLKLKV